MTDNPYAHTARLYRTCGWLGTLPIPYGRKAPPPPGWTGRAGPLPSEADVAAWLELKGPRNIAIRLPGNVIGLDVDGYDGRPGPETLADLEAKVGQLPATWRSTARPHSASTSGIRYYRLPEGISADDWPNQAGPGIDIIRHTHRYAMVWPSLHPNGNTYVWLRPDGGTLTTSIPAIDTLPELPAAWVSHMELLAQRLQGVTARLPHDDVFAGERRFTQDEAREFVGRALETLRDAKVGQINQALNNAAKVLSHFGDEFWAAGEAMRWLREALRCTRYDGKTWKASDTIASAYRSAADDWKAVLASESAAEATEEALRPFLSDLGPYLRGEVIRTPPEIGIEMPGGHHMLYAGKVHSLIGETESGKSWLALMNCAAEMRRAHHVGYVHFEESDPAGTIERLQSLGVPDLDIGKLFHFAGPEERISTDALGELLAFEPSLVVLDGVNDAMALHGFGIYEPDGVSHYRRLIVRPFTARGVAVLELDHVTKAVDTRGRDAFGSVHKGNSVDGARFMLETKRPFGRGRDGESRLYVTKDRPGWLREHGRPDGRVTGKTWVGRLIVHASLAHVAGTVTASVIELPPEVDTRDAASKLGDDVIAAVRRIVARNEKPSKTKIRQEVTGGSNPIDAAIGALQEAGRLNSDLTLTQDQVRGGSIPDPDPDPDS